MASSITSGALKILSSVIQNLSVSQELDIRAYWNNIPTLDFDVGQRVLSQRYTGL